MMPQGTSSGQHGSAPRGSLHFGSSSLSTVCASFCHANLIGQAGWSYTPLYPCLCSRKVAAVELRPEAANPECNGQGRLERARG